MKILVTGCAGFIGYHFSKLLLDNQNIKLYGIDNLAKSENNSLKKIRLFELKKYKKFNFSNTNIANKLKLEKIFKKNIFHSVIHLAAETGIRKSIDNSEIFFSANLRGFKNIIDLSVEKKIKHFIYASSSSVYGENVNYPTKEDEPNKTPLSFYGATKLANELIASSYSNIYKIPTTGLRFFTVYGPYGRKDMAVYKFTEQIINKKSINLNNYGRDLRDFTYIDDVVEAINKIFLDVPKKNNLYRVFNIGNSNCYSTKFLIKLIENKLLKKAKIKFAPKVYGDVKKTLSDCTKIKKKYGYYPKTSLPEGIDKFINWYIEFYKLQI
tara:strand:- start:36106 stop:37080 length:975 start_codon:yes stop_codon:yes gene_type:complete